MDLFKSSKLSPAVLAEIKQLHFQTRHLVTQGVAGQYRSAFRGLGIEFEEVRNYYPGDDVRAIDWKVTARMNQPYIKSFREERELTVMIAVDVSGSTISGTRAQLRETLIAKMGAILTLIALQNNDKVGLVTFSDKLETYQPPKKARGAVWRILHEVLPDAEADPSNKNQSASGTNLEALFGFLLNVIKRKAIVFVLSDFLDSGYEKTLAALARRHDVTAVVITDPSDWKLPEAGLVNIVEPETQKTILLDTSDHHFRSAYAKHTKEHFRQLELMFRRNKIGHLSLETDKPFMHELQRYFGRRSLRERHR